MMPILQQTDHKTVILKYVTYQHRSVSYLLKYNESLLADVMIQHVTSFCLPSQPGRCELKVCSLNISIKYDEHLSLNMSDFSHNNGQTFVTPIPAITVFNNRLRVQKAFV